MDLHVFPIPIPSPSPSPIFKILSKLFFSGCFIYHYTHGYDLVGLACTNYIAKIDPYGLIYLFWLLHNVLLCEYTTVNLPFLQW